MKPVRCRKHSGLWGSTKDLDSLDYRGPAPTGVCALCWVRQGETWVDIPGYEGYQASSLGRVRSLDRLIHHVASKNGKSAYSHMRKGVVLKAAAHKSPANSSGHLTLMLGRDVHLDVHVAVCLAFHGKKPFLKAEVLHMDHDPSNNASDNVKWGTRSENLKMDYARGIDRLRSIK